jgi:serine/threonine protein kinase
MGPEAVAVVTAGTRAPARRAEGTRIGPFRLERYLGGGDDTEVWRADGDGIVVALKLRRAGIDDPLASARLAREASVLRRVRHPALIGLFDAGEDDGEPYLAFVFHDGPTLAERIDDGRVPLAAAAATFAPLAEALAVLHGQAIVHRDVKPANVLLTADGPLLIDAGHASVAGTTYDGWVDAAPAIAGTTSYLAPEAASAPPAPPLDVYALGISILETITGRADPAAARRLERSHPRCGRSPVTRSRHTTAHAAHVPTRPSSISRPSKLRRPRPLRQTPGPRPTDLALRLPIPAAPGSSLGSSTRHATVGSPTSCVRSSSPRPRARGRAG